MQNRGTASTLTQIQRSRVDKLYAQLQSTWFQEERSLSAPKERESTILDFREDRPRAPTQLDVPDDISDSQTPDSTKIKLVHRVVEHRELAGVIDSNAWKVHVHWLDGDLTWEPMEHVT